jgi:hypothetical protein
MFLAETSYLNAMATEVDVRKYLSDIFVFQNNLKQQKLYRHCFSPSIWNMLLGRRKKTRTD